MSLRACLAAAALVSVALPPVPALGDEHPQPPTLTAAGAVLYDPADGRVLHGVQPRRPRPMASTTKLMSALLAVESGRDEQLVTVSAEAAAAGGASVGLTAGQRLPLHDLLAGLVVVSGNDAAVAVAEHVAGSEAAFVEAMNARAAELGLERTTFVNASGLTDDPRHAASPLDLARLADAFLEREPLAALAAAPTVEVPGLGTFETRNELLGHYPGATGVKTGFTALAGHCLVASATRGGRTLYAVVLDSEDSFADAAALLDHGFDDYVRTVPLAAGTPAIRYRWAGAEVDLVAGGTLAATVPAGADLTWRPELFGLPGPAGPGTVAGHAVLLADGRVRARVALRTAGTVAADQPGTPAARAGAALQDALRALAWTAPIERPVEEPVG